MHYRKANGTLAPKVFKLTTRVVRPGEEITIAARRPFVPITTRTYHPGGHALEIQVNGLGFGRVRFEYLEL
ncbi:MAG: alkylation repair protein [Pseudonocardiales bacterium]|nr:alkylation repair protein [Pseudonocardiales bacterium]